MWLCCSKTQRGDFLLEKLCMKSPSAEQSLLLHEGFQWQEHLRPHTQQGATSHLSNLCNRWLTNRAHRRRVFQYTDVNEADLFKPHYPYAFSPGAQQELRVSQGQTEDRCHPHGPVTVKDARIALVHFTSGALLFTFWHNGSIFRCLVHHHPCLSMYSCRKTLPSRQTKPSVFVPKSQTRGRVWLS